MPAYPFITRDAVESWGESEKGPAPRERHEHIMELARAGQLDPIQWVWVPVRGGLEVQVSADAVSYGGIRLCCSVYTAQQVADVLGGMLCTAAIVRAAHRACPIDLDARSNTFATNPGGGVAAWLTQEDAIEAAAREKGWRPGQLLSTVGKDYVLGPYVLAKPNNSPIYGWKHRAAEMSGPPGEQVPMIQSPKSGGGSSHGPVGGAPDAGLWFFDYSHRVRLVHPRARLHGRDVELALVYADRSELVSHLGTVETIPTRHPSVPRAGGGGV